MRRIPRGCFGLALAAGVGLAVAAGCTDRIPTLTNGDRLPPDLVPVTIEHIIPSDDFLIGTIAERGTTGNLDATYLVAARDFDGVLDVHVLTKFEEIPDSIQYPGSTDGAFNWMGGQVRSFVVDSLASASSLDFYLWSVPQAWDSTATWTDAQAGPPAVPWQQEGGTQGELLAIDTWVRSDSSSVADSLVWELGVDQIEALAAMESPSLMVTIETPDSRAQLGPLSMQLSLSPLVDPDTVLTRTISAELQTFIISEGPPAIPDLLSAGGLTSDLSRLNISLPAALPGCADGNCPTVPSTDVTLNRVDLLVDPAPVTGGFRPTGPSTVFVREMLQPELGVQAPLGQVVSAATIPADDFLPGGSEPASFIITLPVAEALREGNFNLGLALLMEPPASSFSYAWFGLNPRLRFIYTLRQIPELP